MTQSLSDPSPTGAQERSGEADQAAGGTFPTPIRPTNTRFPSLPPVSPPLSQSSSRCPPEFLCSSYPTEFPPPPPILSPPTLQPPRLSNTNDASHSLSICTPHYSDTSRQTPHVSRLLPYAQMGEELDLWGWGGRGDVRDCCLRGQALDRRNARAQTKGAPRAFTTPTRKALACLSLDAHACRLARKPGHDGAP